VHWIVSTMAAARRRSDRTSVAVDSFDLVLDARESQESSGWERICIVLGRKDGVVLVGE
jgi:hypothetical protein